MALLQQQPVWLMGAWFGTDDIWIHLLFFFFQAEDGIRDPLVTGVQTCALPISIAAAAAKPPAIAARKPTKSAIAGDRDGRAGTAAASATATLTIRLRSNASAIRSEERRVGKECRSRGSRYH